MNGEGPKEGAPVTVNVNGEDVFGVATHVARTLTAKYENLNYDVDRVHGGTMQQVMTTHIVSY